MRPDYDAIIIGGDANGLVTAAMLAKAGQRVALFEARPTLGGIAATEELIPGFHFNVGEPDAGLFSDEILRALKLEDHGLDWIESPAAAFAPQADARALTLWRDPERNAAEIGAFSKRDAAAFPTFAAQNERFAAILSAIAHSIPPALKDNSTADLLQWAGIALKTRRLGKRDMMEFLRVLPLSAYHYLNQHFESEAIKGLFAALSVTQLMQGPRAAGTAFMLLYQQLGGQSAGYRSMRTVRGGNGALIQAQEAAARSQGVEIHTQQSVQSISVNNYRATGITLSSGETIAAKVVLSAADPRSTFLNLVGAPNLEPRVVRRLQNIKYRGSTASVHLALSALPEFHGAQGQAERLTGDIVICPSLDYAERAYDDAKYGRISQGLILIARIPSLLDPSLAPEGKHAMSITVRYAPFHLRDADWQSQRNKLADLVVETLAQYATRNTLSVQDARVITPLDYERDYGLPEGSFSHGQMGLDQLLLMRPIPGFNGYRSPLDGLYLCGPGAHPGGGLTGLPGFNAARQALKEVR